MKRLILALCLLLPGFAWAQNCIPSGNTSSYTYFVAGDETALVTRETGLSSFTVRRSRNGAASAAFTTPTVNETDSSNMPGVYELLLDEDMTIGSGNDVEHMTLHITHAGMAPVTKEICIARPKITAGETLAVTSGVGNAAVQSVGAGAINLAAFNSDANALFGILRRGTAQSATSTTLVLDSGATFADDTPIGATLVACGSTQGYCQSRLITDYTGSSDTATVSTWPVTPSGTITYYLFASAPGEGGEGGGLDAEGIRDAIGLASANLDDQLSAIDGNVDSILSDTGTDGVVVASGSKTGYSLASTQTFSNTGTWTGNLSGSVGSVSGNVGGTVNGLTSTAQGHVRTAVGLSSANLDAQLSTIDGIVDAIVADTGTDIPALIAALDELIDAIKAKTDNLTFTETGHVDANIKRVNDVQVAGDGQEGSEWGPAE